MRNSFASNYLFYMLVYMSWTLIVPCITLVLFYDKFQIVNWTAPLNYQDSCQIKGQSEFKCHNFVRVFHGPVQNPSADLASSPFQYLVCGTNAFRPTCRWYSEDLKTVHREFSGVGYSPFDPTHLSTSVLHHGSSYAATVADFGGTDSLIYKQPLRTEQNYDLHLNSEFFLLIFYTPLLLLYKNFQNVL
jgi:hypothetical protein